MFWSIMFLITYHCSCMYIAMYLLPVQTPIAGLLKTSCTLSGCRFILSHVQSHLSEALIC